MKILLVEDDDVTAAYIMRGAREGAHAVDCAKTGRDGLFMATEGAYDVIIVDRMLPGLDGLSLVKSLRAAGTKTPIIFLTTMCGIDDRVEGLNAGADDYLTKPFSFSELLARLRALTRRPPLSPTPTVLQVDDLEMDLLRRVVRRGAAIVELQQKEFQLLEFLMRHSGEAVTRTMLLEGVWDFHFEPKTTLVESHISRLRAKLNRDGKPDLIHTIRGSGYSLHAPAPAH
jgi:two-component system OmpR family response regulator